MRVLTSTYQSRGVLRTSSDVNTGVFSRATDQSRPLAVVLYEDDTEELSERSDDVAALARERGTVSRSTPVESARFGTAGFPSPRGLTTTTVSTTPSSNSATTRCFWGLAVRHAGVRRAPRRRVPAGGHRRGVDRTRRRGGSGPTTRFTPRSRTEPSRQSNSGTSGRVSARWRPVGSTTTTPV